jgi:hypothetical protein
VLTFGTQTGAGSLSGVETIERDCSRLGGRDPRYVGGTAEALEEFFDWQEQNRPQARRKTALMLTQLGGPAPALPSDVIADEISTWMKVDEYFKLVAHSKHKTKPEELVSKLFRIEDFLLRRLQPRPVTDLDEIDALLAEAEDAE